MKIDGNSIRLTGNEVAQAIDAYLVEQGIRVVGPRTIRIAGRMPVPPAEVYVDPSGRVVDDRLETALETLGIDRDGAISEADARRLFEHFGFAVAW